MSDLRVRFGKLVAAHRRRVGMTQQELAEAVDASVYMISKIESGASGTRFAMIEKFSKALDVDPAELFTAEVPAGRLRRKAYAAISERLAVLPDADLEWIGEIIEAALKTKRAAATPKI